MDIKVDHVSKAYGEQQVLRDLSCVFPEGKTTCIRGRSGSGKTTLIQLLLRLDVPDKGKIEGISDRKLSAVFQEDRLCRKSERCFQYKTGMQQKQYQTENWRRHIKQLRLLRYGRNRFAN